MDDIKFFVDWMLSMFGSMYEFFNGQHAAVKACVFLPMALIVIKLFFLAAKSLFNGRSLG